MATVAGGARGQRTAWGRNLGAPVRDFLGTETGGAAVLVLAALVALLWANSPWSSSYHSAWHTQLAITLGGHALAASLREWVDEGLMTIFFLVVGLEAKRELSLGELRERSRVLAPALAALGGIALAVGLFLAVNAGGQGAKGWGVAMSTDTAIALGALSLVAPAGTARLRVFLLTLVVVDDLAGLVVIAFAYTSKLSVPAIAVAVGLFGLLVMLRFLPYGRALAAALVGFGIWLALFESGIDPVLAGLAIGLVTSAYPPPRGELERATELARSFREQPSAELARSAQRGLAAAISPNARLQHRLHPWSGFLIVPLFALSNMGVHIDAKSLQDAVSSPVAIGIVLGYVVGKPLGVLGATWLGARKLLRVQRLTVTWPGLAGVGAVAGAGLTISLLIARRAFGAKLFADVQLGLLATVVLSPLVALAVFRITARLPSHVRARQMKGMADELVDLSDDVDPARDHVRGADEAPVTLVEYADFECPFCGSAEPAIRELLAEQGEDLRYVFRHLPLLDVHPLAQLGAEAAEAAGAQGAFWEMHDLLFKHEGKLTREDIDGYAESLQLDLARFAQDLREHAYEARIDADVSSADASGVSGTPTFFVNGRRHHGAYDLGALTAAVQAARRHRGVFART